jgi:DNA modification methylase
MTHAPAAATLQQGTRHVLMIGDCCVRMREIPDDSIHFACFSPPYYNAPFHSPNMFENYAAFKHLLSTVGDELKRVLVPGRKCAWVVDDVRVNGELYPIVADTIRIMCDKGFRYCENISWLKAEGYSRFSRRSGHMKKQALPTYYFPDNVKESILIFQKGKLNNGAYINTLSSTVVKASKIELDKFDRELWNLNVWFIPNVPPVKGRLEEGIAAYPEEIPKRLIQLYSFAGETVLDPFCGSGTSMKVARQLGRNSICIEIFPELEEVIRQKVGFQHWRQGQTDTFEVLPSEHSPKRVTLLLDRTTLAVTQRCASAAGPRGRV